MSLVPYPGAKFWLAGVGQRRKLLFTPQGLFDARSGECVRPWQNATLRFSPDEIGVEIETLGLEARAWEDETGVWMEEANEARLLSHELSGGPQVTFASFAGHPHAALLRKLAHEIHVNVVDGLPLPNLLVYDQPWHRDAAMMALVLQKTGNLGLLEKWVAGLRDPFDYNNKGHREPDNLGQMLVILALLDQAHHPLRDTILRLTSEFGKENYIEGITDYAPHPVYQTKWLKWGLQKLGLDDDHEIPLILDDYSSLFWMDYRDQHVLGPRFSAEQGQLYPYLAWAEAHFYTQAPPYHLAAAENAAPLTWEAEASEAKYPRQELFLPQLAGLKCAAPHTWHSAEMFLYLHELGSVAAPPS